MKTFPAFGNHQLSRFVIYIVMFCVLLFSGYAIAGGGMRDLGGKAVPPGSNAFSMSLDDWTGEYIRWLEDGMDPAARVKNAAFLPIIGASPFEVEVEPGVALILPVYTYLGFPGDDYLPDEWWGNEIFGYVHLDGQLIADVNRDYYVGPTYLVPPAILFGVYTIDFYQALTVVIEPLSAGEHVITLHSENTMTGEVYDNTWNIKVTPAGKNK